MEKSHSSERKRTMKLHVYDEFSSLKSVVVCWGEAVPEYDDYKTDEEEFHKFHPYPWDRSLMLKQQEAFFTVLQKYHVNLLFPKTSPDLIWQMYTRDTAAVIHDKLYYSVTRKFKEREGEIENLFELLQLEPSQLIPIEGLLEGGDVLIHSASDCYIGNTSRTAAAAIEQVKRHVPVKMFTLGEWVMHTDTRLTLLPNKVVLMNPTPFSEEDKAFLHSEYSVIAVTDYEATRLGTNVFCVNPETLIVPKEHTRIAKELQQKGFNIEIVDYSEPISYGGAFRCTTLPIERG